MSVNSTPNIHSIVICANLFVRKDGKVLMIRRSPEKIDLPGLVHPIGGKIDANEDPLMAAQRELMEEAGITAENIRLEAVVSEVPDPQDPQYKETWLIFDFSGDYKDGEVRPTEEGELVWLTPQEIMHAKMFASVEHIIPTILDERVGTVFARFVYDKDRKIISKEITVTPR